MTTAAFSRTGHKVLTERIGRIEVSATMAITAEALKMKAAGIYAERISVRGSRTFETPRHIKDAAIAAINQGFTRYTAVAGTPDVRKAICARHAADFGTDYTAEECVFTTGGKLALFNALQVLVRAWRRGDTAGAVLGFLQGHHPVCGRGAGELVETDERENFQVTAAMIEAAMTDKTKAIILNTPSNPSGAVMAKDDIRAIVRLAQERGVYVLLDECYVYLTFEGEPLSGASVQEREGARGGAWVAFEDVCDDGLAGGVCAGAEADDRGDEQAAVAVDRTAAALVQKASVAAVSESQECVSEMRADYIKLRDRVLAGLATIPGLTCTVPQGAFYVYPNVSAFMARTG